MMFGTRSLLAAFVTAAVLAGASATAGSASPSAGGSGAGPLSGFRSVLAQRSNSQDHVNSRRRFQMVSWVVTGLVEANPNKGRSGAGGRLDTRVFSFVFGRQAQALHRLADRMLYFVTYE